MCASCAEQLSFHRWPSLPSALPQARFEERCLEGSRVSKEAYQAGGAELYQSLENKPRWKVNSAASQWLVPRGGHL